MKKIGLIDLHIDEWHANHYPEWFAAAPSGKDFTIAGAWEQSPTPGGQALDAWCAAHGLAPYRDQEKLIADCDCFCVLAPSNPEAHEELAALALASGKPVFIDKPFAPDRQSAERMFARAGRNRTPLFSSSALRFGTELSALRGSFPVEFMATRGGGSNFPEYAIHQLEMIVSVMGHGVKSLVRKDSGSTRHLILEFGDGRLATLTQHPDLPFGGFLTGEHRHAEIAGFSNMFPNMVEAMLQFFAGAPAPVARRETIAIAELLDTAIRAAQNPGERILLGKD